MVNLEPFSWKPDDVVEVTNVSEQNILLELPSGLERLDKGRVIKIVASALQLPQLKTLVDNGQITTKKYRWR